MKNGLNWGIVSLVFVVIGISGTIWYYERKKTNNKELAFTAVMASIAAISRVVFAPIMSLQPTTFIVMITGYVFGPVIGFLVGAASAFVSNLFLGQGPWTPWQMMAWGLAGVSAGFMTRIQKDIKPLYIAAFCGLWGYVFGWIMNLWHWLSFVFPLTWKTFAATYAASFPFDTLHALGNVVFSMVFGRSFYDILMRFRKKIRVVYLDNK